MRFLFVILLVVAGLYSEKSCKAETTEEMLSACRPITVAKVSGGTIDFEETFETGICWGAFAAIQRLSATVDHNEKPLLFSCPPEDSTQTQIITIFVRYAEKHPEKYHQDFVFSAIAALKEAFPCPARK